MPVMSHSWNASVPIRCERTWPVTKTSGVESISASAMRRDEVRRARAGGRDRDARLAGRAGVALGQWPRALLVTCQDVPDGRAARERVVDREDRPARDPEADVDALRLERAEHGVAAR